MLVEQIRDGEPPLPDKQLAAPREHRPDAEPAVPARDRRRSATRRRDPVRPPSRALEPAPSDRPGPSDAEDDA